VSNAPQLYQNIVLINRNQHDNLIVQRTERLAQEGKEGNALGKETESPKSILDFAQSFQDNYPSTRLVCAEIDKFDLSRI
jgi:hypothetical protein